jgi:hypothetical protein
MEMALLVQILMSAFPNFRDFLSSPVGGQIANLVSGAADAADWDDFTARVEAMDEETQGVLLRELGIGPSPDQGIIDKYENMDVDYGPGFDLPESYPSATEAARDLAERGERLSAQHFDPVAAAERYRGLFGDISEEYAALPGEVAAGSQDVQSAYDALRAELETGGDELMGDYEDWWGGARELVSELGEWERGDINRRYDEAGRETQQAMSARGLGSTGLASIGAGNERERTSDLLRLQEQTVEQRLGVEMDFGGAQLTAQERLLAAGINIGGQAANAMQFGNQLWANTAMGSLDARAGIAGGEFGAYDQAAINRLNSMRMFGEGAIGTQLDATQMWLRYQAEKPMIMPQQNQSADVYPSFGR